MFRDDEHDVGSNGVTTMHWTAREFVFLHDFPEGGRLRGLFSQQNESG
jgi:hypothetical protein